MTAASPPSPSFARFAWIVLAWTVAVAIWGAYVRATGSGAGCGSHWPLCDGAVLPTSGTTAQLIEYSHRATSGVAFIASLALWLRARRSPVVPAAARQAALLGFVFMSLEALLGASLVLFEMVADNASLARAMFMAAHLVNTFALVAALTVTALAASGRALPGLSARVSPLWYVAGAALLLTNMSGAVAALGDTLYPARSLAEALQQDLSISSHVLIRLRLLHPLIAILSAAGVAVFAMRVRGRALAATLVVQLIAGAINVLLLAPVWLQLLHLLIANVAWILFVSLWLTSPQARRAPLYGVPAGRVSVG
ncbi:MAG: COX15/CtaA family protein [Vicinamibacterales bacterium]